MLGKIGDIARFGTTCPEVGLQSKIGGIVMGLFKKNHEAKSKVEGNNGVAPFDDFTMVTKTYLVDGIYSIGLPVDWKPFESDRFRAKTDDGKTQISITNYNMKLDGTCSIEEELKKLVLPQYEDFITGGGYVPYDDLIVNEKYISRSFKIDNETQYYLTTINSINGNNILTGFIIRDIDEYRPQMRAFLLNIASMMMFV